VILSRNEVSATLSKAARGQGLPQGHADIFVPAAVCALANGAEASDVTTALRGPHGPVDFDNARVAIAGPIAIDALICGEDTVVLRNVDAVSILIGISDNAFKNKDLCVEVKVKGEIYNLCLAKRTAPRVLTRGPLSIPKDDWDLWQNWAAKTYVPATAQSRLSGAGAGLNDND